MLQIISFYHCVPLLWYVTKFPKALLQAGDVVSGSP